MIERREVLNFGKHGKLEKGEVVIDDFGEYAVVTQNSNEDGAKIEYPDGSFRETHILFQEFEGKENVTGRMAFKEFKREERELEIKRKYWENRLN
ncbi:MAG: hypothetical protein U9Q06_02015 [Nanoarchaeota archaeon]|nr:hypothetical protein [Nanoarchaeota archaeon]